MLFYNLAAFVIAVYTRKPFPGMAFLVVFHWMFYKSVFGTDWVSNFNYDLYYPTAFIVWTVAGLMFCWAFGHPSLFKMITRGGHNSAEFAIRMMASLLIFLAVPLPFELIEHFSGGIVTLILAIVAPLIAYYLLKTFNVMMMRKKVGDSECKVPPNVTLDFAIYMGIVYFITCAVFWPVFEWTTFWQLYLSVIIGGFFILFFIAAKFLWLGSDNGSLSWMNKGSDRCRNTSYQPMDRGIPVLDCRGGGDPHKGGNYNPTGSYPC